MEARYVPFVDFRSWARVHVDEPRWMRYVGVLGRRSGAAEEAVRRDVEDRLLRAAALDSAALDGLLAANPELTTAVLSSSIHPGEAISAVQESVRLVAECNYRALVLVREAAQEGRIVDEPFIALLFDVITESQATYTVTDEEGAVVEVELPRRQYKPVTNYLRHPDGLRVFAPASRVPEEMGRLAAELASAEFQHAHPAVQAAYAHYALTVVHPFADANGRLARAAASVYLLRAIGVPLLVFADQWPSYYQAVSAADGGDFQRLTDAVAAFAMAAIELKANLLATRAEAGLTMHPRAVAAPQPPASVPEQAARTLLDVLWVELREALVSPPPGLRLALGETHELPVGYAEPVYRVVADPATGGGGCPPGAERRRRSVRGTRPGVPRARLSAERRPASRVGQGDAQRRAARVHARRHVSVCPRGYGPACPGLDRPPRRRRTRGGPLTPTASSPRALFVLGAPRSGTTLIGSYLGSSPQVANLAEYGGFYVAYSIAPSVIGRLPGYHHDVYLEELQRHALAFAERTATRDGLDWYCDSTPWNLEIAADLVGAVPQALFVLMLRHYSGTILSLRQLPWSGETWEDAARLWCALNAKTAELPEDRVIPVSYEALAEEPERTLSALLAALETHGFDTAGLDPRMLTLSHAAVVGSPRPAIGVLEGENVRLRAIPSLEAQRWSGDIHRRVWPLVRETHYELFRRFPGIYRCPPRPPTLTVHDDRRGAVPYEAEGW